MASTQAAVEPAGPAPTTMTSGLVIMERLQWGGMLHHEDAKAQRGKAGKILLPPFASSCLRGGDSWRSDAMWREDLDDFRDHAAVGGGQGVAAAVERAGLGHAQGAGG